MKHCDPAEANIYMLTNESRQQSKHDKLNNLVHTLTNFEWFMFTSRESALQLARSLLHFSIHVLTIL